MKIGLIAVNGVQVAEVTGEAKSLKGPQDVHDLIGEIAFDHGVTRVLASRELIDESFFDLRSGFAGELAQKFSNYRMKLAVVGDFSFIESLALKAYIFESNLGNTVRFLEDRAKAMDWLARA